MLCCQSVSPWSSTSTSDGSHQSSIEVKEFYYDDEVVDVADWTTLTLCGDGLVTRREDGYVMTRHHVKPDRTTTQDAAVGTGNGALMSSSADKTLTAGKRYHYNTVQYSGHLQHSFNGLFPGQPT